MKLLDNIKNIFKKSDKSKDITPTLFKEKNEKQSEVEKLLAEQLAEDQKRKHDWDEKSLAEINEKHKERVKAKEQLTKQLAEDRKREKGFKETSKTHSEAEKSVPIKYDNRIESQKKSIEERKIDELKFNEQRAERIRFDEIQAEEQRKRDEEKQRLDKIHAEERKILERERLKQIHALYNEQFVEYLKEAELFRNKFGKNIRCDVGGEWECDLYFFKGQTYCEKHLPPEHHREIERKVKAGRHGSSKDFIKK
jgi:hypothetical protein